MQMAQKHAALVIGVCSHGLSVIRALHAQGVTVFAVEKSTDIPGVKTNTIARLFKVNAFSAEELLLSLPEIRKSLSEWEDIVLFATNDNHVKFICDYYLQLAPYFKVSWASQREAVQQLIDKRNLEQFSKAVGLNYPKSAILTDQTKQNGALNNFRYPVILKPAKPLSSFKTQIANSPSAISYLIEKFAADLPFVAQEYIAGNDKALYFCALVVRDGEIIQSMVGQKISSYPPARGQTTIAQTVENKEVEMLTARFFSQFKLSGPVSLEMKKAPDNTYWVIEPTVGRTDFWSELCIAAGFNQPYQEYLIALGQSLSPPQPLHAVVWFDCERAPLNYLKSCWSQKKLKPNSKALAFTYFSIKDIKPFIFACIAITKRVLFKR
jgi:predicted ATP-grasp superfamily ATP-dependent carboligase